MALTLPPGGKHLSLLPPCHAHNPCPPSWGSLFVPSPPLATLSRLSGGCHCPGLSSRHGPEARTGDQGLPGCDLRSWVSAPGCLSTHRPWKREGKDWAVVSRGPSPGPDPHQAVGIPTLSSPLQHLQGPRSHPRAPTSSIGIPQSQPGTPAFNLPYLAQSGCC